MTNEELTQLSKITERIGAIEKAVEERDIWPLTPDGVCSRCKGPAGSRYWINVNDRYCMKCVTGDLAYYPRNKWGCWGGDEPKPLSWFERLKVWFLMK